jgi:hypothetical protein
VDGLAFRVRRNRVDEPDQGHGDREQDSCPAWSSGCHSVTVGVLIGMIVKTKDWRWKSNIRLDVGREDIYP